MLLNSQKKKELYLLKWKRRRGIEIIITIKSSLLASKILVLG